MRSLIRLLLLVVLGVVVAGCGDDDVQGNRADAATNTNQNNTTPPVASIHFTEAERFTIADSSDHLAFPSVTALADGRLLLVYRQGTSHVDDTGRIMKQFGTSDGLTWTDPEVLYDEPGVDDRDPSATVLPDGTVLVTYFQYVTTTVSGASLSLHQIFGGRSTDNGATFGPFTAISDGPMEAPGAHLSDGLWVDGNEDPIWVHACSSPAVSGAARIRLPSYGGQALNLADLADAPRSRISIWETTDDGATWSETPMNPTALPTVWLQEPALLDLGQGHLVMHARSADDDSPGSPGALLQATSADDGATWSDWTPFTFVGHAPDLLRLENGVLLSAFREINDAFTQEWVSFIHSETDSATWSPVQRVESCGAAECGYPSLVELPGDRLLMVFYTAGGATIDGVIFEFQVSYR